MNVRLTSRVVLAVAVVLGLVAAVLVARYVNTATARHPVAVALKPEVVAAQDIPFDTVVSPAMVRVVSVPARYAVPGAATSTAQVVGNIAESQIFPGEPVLAADLSNGLSGSGLAFIIPRGQVALTIAVDQLSGQDGMLRAGDRVDILAVLTPGNGVATQRVTTAIRSVRILAVGQVTAPGTAAGGYGTVTLAVSPLHAEEIEYLERFESVVLTLQPTEHRSVAHVPGFDQSGLAGVAS